MDNTAISAALGLLGVVLGGLIKTFEDDIRSLLPGRSKDHKRWLGGWKCTWHTQPATGNQPDQPIRDVVVIDKVRGEHITATGQSYGGGKYHLTGRVSPSDLVTFFYKGESEKEFLGGVIILLPTKMTRGEMTGNWWQCTEDGKFIGGSVEWEKQRA